MAQLTVELAEVARHALWRLRVFLPSASPRSPTTNSRFRSFAAGEIVPGLQVLDAVQNGTVEMGNTAMYYYLRQGPGLHLRHRAAVRPQQPPDERVAALRRRQRAAQRAAARSTTASAFAAGNTGAQMGGWFRKEIKTVDDLKGLKIRIGGFAGTHPGQARRRAAAARRRRHLSGAGEGHDRRLRMGRPLRRREARLPEGRASTTTIPAGGKAAARATTSSTWPSGTSCRSTTRPRSMAASRRRHGTGCSANTMPAIRRRSSAWSPAARCCAPSRRTSWRPATRPPTRSTPELSQTNPHFKKLYDSVVAFRSDSYQWMQVAELGFDTFMMRMRTRT